jgi:hypothetical protein
MGAWMVDYGKRESGMPGGRMRIRRIVPIITSERLEDSREFYTEVIGLSTEMDLGWIIGGVQPGTYDVLFDARTDPVPGPHGGGNPTAVLENCALTVFVVPVA